LPAGLSNLTALYLTGNQLTNFTVPADALQLSTLLLDSNPLMTFVLPEPLAATNLASAVDFLRNRGVSVFTYPLMARLVQPKAPAGAFEFRIVGPPGTYSVLGSTNVAAWDVLGTVTNALGSVNFTDVTASSSQLKFYTAFLQGPPTNMVFIGSN